MTITTSINQNLIAYFCNHLIAIAFNYYVDRKGGAPKVLIWSATYIEINGNYFFLTAGHCIRELEQAISDGTMPDFTCYVIDTLGSRAINQSPIPFDYTSARKYAIDQGHLDYGLIEVRGAFQRLLQANGIEPIRAPHWATQRSIEFSGYALLGIPAETVQSKLVNSREVSTRMEPTLIFLRRTPEQSNNEQRFTTFLPENHGVISIRGMSGGPIIGFAEKNGLRYWLFAIQSAWNAQSGQIFATWLPDIIDHFTVTQR